MKLSFEQIKSVTTGAVDVTEENGYVNFYRMSAAQLAVYAPENKKNIYIPHLKARATAGVCLKFATNSASLKISGTTIHAGRGFYSIEVIVNGAPIGVIDNFSDKEVPEFFAAMVYPDGDFEKTFNLGDGEKNVVIRLPFCCITKIADIELDDGSFVTPLKAKRTVLFFGDSITQGYDVLRNYNRYTSLLAESLGADEYSKAVGGEFFCPELPLMKEDFTPDYIFVAYGTNDFTNIPEEKFQENCQLFYENIAKTYPNSKIFALSPILRRDVYDSGKEDYFFRIEKFIEACANKYKNVQYIKCFDFVPNDEKLFSDGRLHPNDEGFKLYAKALIKSISEF